MHSTLHSRAHQQTQPSSHTKPTRCEGIATEKYPFACPYPTQLSLFFGFGHAFQLSLFSFCFFSCRLFFFQQYGRCPERGTQKRNHHDTKAQKPRPRIQQNSNDHCFETGSILRQSLEHFFGRFFGSSGSLHVVALSGAIKVWPLSPPLSGNPLRDFQWSSMQWIQVLEC